MTIRITGKKNVKTAVRRRTNERQPAFVSAHRSIRLTRSHPPTSVRRPAFRFRSRQRGFDPPRPSGRVRPGREFEIDLLESGFCPLESRVRDFPFLEVVDDVADLWRVTARTTIESVVGERLSPSRVARLFHRIRSSSNAAGFAAVSIVSRLEPPCSSTRSVGVPSATSAPSASKPTRSARRSASAMSCVVGRRSSRPRRATRSDARPSADPRGRYRSSARPERGRQDR